MDFVLKNAHTIKGSFIRWSRYSLFVEWQSRRIPHLFTGYLYSFQIPIWMLRDEIITARI